jgi:hypothetical protein
VLLIGFVAGKKLRLDIETLARVYLYVFLTPVVFYGVLKVPLFSGGMLIPVLFFIISSIISIIFLFVGKLFWKDSTANLLSFTTGTGNVGNFGVPLAIAVLGSAATGPAIMANVGVIFYIQTLGFFIASKGKYSVKQSLINLAKLFPLYAFIFGIIAQLFGINAQNSIVSQTLDPFVSAYNIVGFLLVGVGLTNITKDSFDKLYVTFSLIAKFAVWPILVLFVIALDNAFFHVFSPLIDKVMIMQAITPIALSIISYSTILKLHAEKAALAVFVSTLFALIYIPFMASILLR